MRDARPRLYWLSWNILPDRGHETLDMGGYLKVVTVKVPRGSAPAMAGPHGRQRKATTAAEQEVLLGFPRNYTSVAVKGSSAGESERVRCSLLEGSFSCYVVGWLVQHCLLQERLLSALIPARDLLGVCECRDFQSVSIELVKEQPEETEVGRRLVAYYLRTADKAGTDVRIDAGLPFRPRAWPRAAVSPDLWEWRLGHCKAWPPHQDSHINVLEAKSCLAALRWRCRKASFASCRYLHLIDSQVAIGVLTKHRSSSGRLKILVRQWSALCVARDVYPILCYVHSELNPADGPSRKKWGSDP